MNKQECNNETRKHRDAVKKLISRLAIALIDRSIEHDVSKLESPEVEIFMEYTSKLKDTTYGSDEYRKYLKEMKKGLDHHYAENRHHPEYFIYGIQGMNLVDLIEMLCDWKAATSRHANGDIVKSIELNQERFKYSEDLKQVFLNTISDMEEE